MRYETDNEKHCFILAKDTLKSSKNPITNNSRKKDNNFFDILRDQIKLIYFDIPMSRMSSCTQRTPRAFSQTYVYIFRYIFILFIVCKVKPFNTPFTSS